MNVPGVRQHREVVDDSRFPFFQHRAKGSAVGQPGLVIGQRTTHIAAVYEGAQHIRRIIVQGNGNSADERAVQQDLQPSGQGTGKVERTQGVVM